MSGRLKPQQVQFFKDQYYLLYISPCSRSCRGSTRSRTTSRSRVVEFVERTGKSPEHLDVPHFTTTRGYSTGSSPDEVLDVVESIIGPDIALWSSHFICKPPGVGKRVPWHEDSRTGARCSTRWRS